jgi:hypothetical protein
MSTLKFTLKCTLNLLLHVNFNVFVSKYTVHPLVNIKKNFDNIKLHGTTTKITTEIIFNFVKIEECSRMINNTEIKYIFTYT